MQTKGSTVSRALVYDGQISLAVLDTTALVAEAAVRHALKADAAAVLGKTLTAAGYLCGWLKGENSSLTVSVRGAGEFHRINVLGDGGLRLRGYVARAEKGNGRLGKGTLSVVRDDGDGLPFTGTVALVSEEMEDNFTAYFKESEQLQTAVALSVVTDKDKIVSSGGVFLQALPFADAAARSFLEEGKTRLQRLLGEGAYETILSELGVRKADTREIKFACPCSRARVESLILSMGREEAFALLEEEGKISAHCEYCNTDYEFGREEIRKLFGKYER